MARERTTVPVDELGMSVVLLVGRERERGARCLGSLLAQSIVDQIEVLLVDLGAPLAGPLNGSEHPCVRVLDLPATMSFGALQAEGVRRARAPIVGFLEEHCVALPGWAESLVLAHEGPAAAVGGERHNPSPGGGLPWLIHEMDRGPWSAPAVDQATSRLPGGNVAYKRDLLLRYGDRLDVYFQSEGLLQARLVEDGWTLRVAPSARYQHAYEDSLADLGRRWFVQAYLTSAARAELHDQPRRLRARDFTRWLRAVASGPLLMLRLPADGSAGGTSRVLLKARVALVFSLSRLLGEMASAVSGRRDGSSKLGHRLLGGSRATAQRSRSAAVDGLDA